AKWRHDAHHSTVAKVYYHLHPLHGQEVRVFRRHPTTEGGDVVVILADRSQCTLPRWMLDPVICSGLVEAAAPRLSVQALLALRVLLDAQSTLRGEAASSRAEDSPHGGDHASEEVPSAAARVR
ncbi:MAG: DUF5372 family protein, partial [Planctomycetota bacterium]